MVICEIRTGFMVVEVSIGLMLNTILIRLIYRHTPRVMRVYSKILLQTCIVDILLLVMTALGDEIYLNSNGGAGAWNNGILQWIGFDSYNPLSFFVSFCWSFLINAWLFLLCAQYVYRYLTVNRSMDISTRQYLAIVAAFSIVPLLFQCKITQAALRAGKVLIKDESVAGILGLNISTKNISFLKFNFYEDSMLTVAFYYFISVNTIGYILLIVLGWRIHRFVQENLKLASNAMRRNAKLDTQFTRALLLQAQLPSFFYISQVFSLAVMLFHIDLDGIAQAMQYYTALAPIPMYTPAMLNPAVAIICVSPYRRAFLRWIRKFNEQPTYREQ